MDNGMTPEQFVNIAEKIKKTQDDTTPFAIVANDAVSVSGDANKTEIKKNDYEIKFRVPKEMFDGKPDGAQEVGDNYILTVNYKDVTITPRNDLKIVGAMFELEPFINKLKEDGSVEAMDSKELVITLAHAGEQIHIAIYNLVATFLGIDDKMGEYMLPFSVIGALTKIIDTHPEIINQSDAFFG